MYKNKFLRGVTVWPQPVAAEFLHTMVWAQQLFPPFPKHTFLLHPWHLLCFRWVSSPASLLCWPILTHLLRPNWNVIASVKCPPTASSWVKLSPISVLLDFVVHTTVSSVDWALCREELCFSLSVNKQPIVGHLLGNKHHSRPCKCTCVQDRWDFSLVGASCLGGTLTDTEAIIMQFGKYKSYGWREWGNVFQTKTFFLNFCI